MAAPLASRLLWCLAWLGGSLPARARWRLAGALAARDLRRNSKRARVARANASLIGHADPHLVSDTLIHAAATLHESLRFWTRPASRNLAALTAVDGLATWQAARAKGGVLIVAPHQGNWELLVQWLAAQGPFSLLYTRGESAVTDGFLKLARERHGVRAVAADAHGMKPLLRALQQDEVVGITPDQRPDGGAGLWSPFFGQPALTMSLIPRLLQRTGATPLLAAAVREGDGQFRLVIRPAPAAMADADLQVATDAMNAAVEAFVRDTGLGQYQWTYKRFRGLRPDGTQHNPYWPECY
jgi:KDO2-lipid IV(A) lauroyltransferase